MSTDAPSGGCPFCPANWPNLNIVVDLRPHDDILIINPLDPVTKGHVLVIHAVHTEDASKNARVAEELMGAAAAHVALEGIQANIITSIGAHATQTVMHTHVHVVPRREGDGLPLPWSTQCTQCHGTPVVARGRCARCYKRWQRSTESPKAPPDHSDLRFGRFGTTSVSGAPSWADGVADDD